MATAGRVAPLPRDKFVKGEPYEKLDVVEYNGNLYMAKKASSGVLPTDTEYWMLAIDLTGKLDTTGDTENNTVTFTSNDAEDPTAWQDVAVMGSKEKHTSLFSKISTMFSNMRYLYKLLGTADISDLGSVTQAIATLSGNVGNMKGISSSAAITTEGEYALDAREKNASVEGTLANQLDVLNSNLDKTVSSAAWLPQNGYNPLDNGTSAISIYSIHPGMMIEQGIPTEGFLQYGTIIAFRLAEYKFMIYIDVARHMAIYHDGCWKNYDKLVVEGVAGHNYKLGFDDSDLYVIVDNTRFDIQTK